MPSGISAAVVSAASELILKPNAIVSQIDARARGRAANAARRRCPRPSRRLCRRRSGGTPGKGGRRTRRARGGHRPVGRADRGGEPLRERTPRRSPWPIAERASAAPPPCCRCAARWSRRDCPSRSSCGSGSRERAAHHDRERHGADQIRGDDDRRARRARSARRVGSGRIDRDSRAKPARARRRDWRAHERHLHPRSARRDAHRRLRVGAASAADDPPRRRVGLPSDASVRSPANSPTRSTTPRSSSASRRSPRTIRTSCWSASPKAIAQTRAWPSSARRR